MRKLLNYILPVIVFSLLMSVMPITTETTFANKVATADTLYDEVYENLSNYKTSFEVQFTGDTKTLNARLNQMIKDVEAKDRYLYENISNWKISMSSKSTSATIKFQMQYMMTKQQEDFVNEQITSVLPTLYTEAATEFDQVKAIHDYVVKTMRYSDQTVGSQYSTHTLLTENKGVCQAYALLMDKMLEQAGFETMYMKGTAGNDTHAWNLVNIEGEWFHVDATWNDPVGNEEGETSHKYFLLTDSQIAKTHTWAKDAYPTATSAKYVSLKVAK